MKPVKTSLASLKSYFSYRQQLPWKHQDPQCITPTLNTLRRWAKYSNFLKQHGTVFLADYLTGVGYIVHFVGAYF